MHRDHRGHRLGQALKAANLLALQRRHPEVTEVHTQNAEVNEQMVAINDRVGVRAGRGRPGLQARAVAAEKHMLAEVLAV